MTFLLRYSFLILLTCYTSYTFAQRTLRGKVLDAEKHKPVSGVVIKDVDGTDMATTDAYGYFELKITNPEPARYSFEAKNYIGFDLDFTWNDTLEDNTYFMVLEVQELETVVVRNTKKRYRNKDNPAVALIRQVIAHKDENKYASTDKASYDSYEKITVSTTNVPKWVRNFILFRPFRYIFHNVDSTSLPGYKVMPMYIEEIWSKNYAKQDPVVVKKVIDRNKKIAFDRDYINEDGAVGKLKHLYQDMNIYDDNFILVSNNFMSPTNPVAPTFYKYYILDTVVEDNERFIVLEFEPRNPVDLLLRGRLTIALDNNYAITNAELSTSKFVNINFIKQMVLQQKFKKNESGKYYPYFDRNFTQFVLMDGIKQGMVGERVIHREKYKPVPELNDSFFTEPLVERQLIDSNYTMLDYEQARPVSLNAHEYRTYRDVDSMRNSAYFKALVRFSYIMSKGFFPIGNYELGPLYRTVSSNDVEGMRFRFGGRNNNLKIRNFNINTYVAYGMKDQRWKYLLSGMYSLNGKGLFEYPMRYVRGHVQRENKVPGRLYEVAVQDNIFETIQRGTNDKFVDVKDVYLEYMHELPKNVQLSADLRYTHQSPIGALYFVKQNGGIMDTVDHVVSTIAGIRARWAPGEQFMINRAERTKLLHQAPIFNFRAEMGIPKLLGGTTSYKKLSLSVDKRTNLGPLGFLDARVAGNVIFGTLPYHLLNIPRANQGYTFSFNSYMLMNNGEFVSDRQVEAIVNYRMMGFIFNKIPLIKRLKWREVAGFKMVYGSLSAKNNPNKNADQFLFPTDSEGRQLINEFGKTPYMEYSVGIENIFKIFRLDYVRRLTYLDNPFINKEGIRATLIFNF